MVAGLFTECQTSRQRGRRYTPAGTPLPEPVPDHLPLPEHLPLPAGFQRAAGFARRLSGGVDCARFDFLVHGETVFGGEITVFTNAGYAEFAEPIAGWVDRMWDLRRSFFLREGASRGGWLARAYAVALSRALSG